MKVTKITFEQLYPTGQYANQRLGIEIAIDEFEAMKDENIANAYSYAKNLVNDAFKSLNPELSTPSITDYNTGQPAEIQVEKRIGLLTDDILNCQDLKILESYKLIVRAKPELQAAYDQRLKELS